MWCSVIVHGLSQQKSDIKLPFQPLFIVFQDFSALQAAWATSMASLGTQEFLLFLLSIFQNLQNSS